MLLLMLLLLAITTTGLNCGLVLDIGDGLSHTLPVFDDYIIPHAIGHTSRVAGRSLTDYMVRVRMLL